MGRVKKIGFAIFGIIVFLIIVGLLIEEIPPTGQPNKFGLFFVAGDPENVYTVYFALMDEKQRNIVAEGEVTLRIFDARNRVLYEETHYLTVKDYSKYTHQIFGGEFWGYSWDIKGSKVKPGAPDIVGTGTAKITFKRTDGVSFSDEYTLIEIPSLPPIRITSVEIDKTNKDLYVWALAPFETYYPGDQIAIEISVSYFSISGSKTITINSIEIVTPGFDIISVSPNLPFEVGSERIKVKITLDVPDQQFEGDLNIRIS